MSLKEHEKLKWQDAKLLAKGILESMSSYCHAQLILVSFLVMDRVKHGPIKLNCEEARVSG